MGKKNKKFKKKRHHFVQPVRKEQPVKDSVATEEVIESVSQDKPAPAKDKEEKPDFYETDKYAYVKKDIVKILIIMASILIVLVAVYYTSLKTNIFNSLGDWIYKVTHINVG